MKKLHLTLLTFSIFCLLGCDQIKSRLFEKNELPELNSKTEKTPRSEYSVEKGTPTVKDENQNLPRNFENKKKEKAQIKIINQRSENQVENEIYSIIGTKDGKPIRNNKSQSRGD